MIEHGANLPPISRIEGYGQLSIEQIEAHGTQYVNLQTRQAQNLQKNLQAHRRKQSNILSDHTENQPTKV